MKKDQPAKDLNFQTVQPPVKPKPWIVQPKKQQQEQKFGSLLCSCSLAKPEIHYRKTTVPQQIKHHPLNCIGKIIVFTLLQDRKPIQVKETQATGFLIGHGIAMTAASCLTSPLDIQKGYPQTMIFFEILDDNGQIKWFKVLLWVIHKDFQKKLVLFNYHEHDLALLFFDDKEIQLKRNLKLNYTQQKQQGLKIAFCPSNFSQLYKKHQTNIQEHVQLFGKKNFNGQKYSCMNHWYEPVTEGFAGSPLLRFFINKNAQFDCEVIGLIRNYQTNLWWLGVKVIFSSRNNGLIGLCKVITEGKKPVTFEYFVKEIAKIKQELYVLNCIEVWPECIDKKITQRMQKYCYKKK